MGELRGGSTVGGYPIESTKSSKERIDTTLKNIGLIKSINTTSTLNNLKEPGFYQIKTQEMITLSDGSLLGSTDYYAQVIVNNDSIWQILIDTIGGTMVVRMFSSSSWGTWNRVGGKVYSLPTATASVLGGVKTSTNITNTSGTISINNGSTTVKGVVQLTDGVASTSTSTAATPNSVKVVNDALTTHVNDNLRHTQAANMTLTGTLANVEGTNNVASAQYAHAEGSWTNATNDSAHSEGTWTTASGAFSHSEGCGTAASGHRSHVEGSYAKAEGFASHAEGVRGKALSQSTHAEGEDCTASGFASHAEGHQTTATVWSSHSQGRFNKTMTGSGTTVSANTDAFVIGNGTSATALSNAFRVTFAGQTYGLSAFNSTGADYAEYFEWLDGNETNEDRVGFVVTMVDDKIRFATSEDEYILGIISANPSVVGDSYQDDWVGRYELDDWGRKITEEYEFDFIEPDEESGEDKIVKKIGTRFKANPNWSFEEEYTPREQRKEWDAVGLVGKLLVRQDGTCKPNEYAKVGKENGTLTYSNEPTNMRVMQVLSDKIIQVFIK